MHSKSVISRSGSGRVVSAAAIALTAVAVAGLGVSMAYAKGGATTTVAPVGGKAKPAPGAPAGGGILPQNAKGGGGTTGIIPLFTGPFPLAPNVPPPIFSAPVANIAGFDVTGFLQKARVDPNMCPTLPSSQWGGTVIANGLTITVPCNTTLQMPAATYTFADLIDASVFPTPLGLSGARPPAGRPVVYPSTEISIAGNIVNGKYIAGLITISQQSLNGAGGYIVSIEYDGAGKSTGAMMIGPVVGGPAHVRIQINDPIAAGDTTGKFTRGQSPDNRFSVDPENPTIVTASGYPMCIPRTNTADDPLCPAKNRPRVDLTDGAGGCRNFAQTGVFSPAGWELAAPAAGQVFCPAFVMKAVAGTTVFPAGTVFASATEPDARQQVPFKVGDFINYTGTLMQGSGGGPDSSDTMSIHTITGNLGVFTQPGTLPLYNFVDGTLIGANAIPVQNGIPPIAPLEGQDRLIFEGRTTDVTTPVDLYLIDVHPVTGVQTNRWVLTEPMMNLSSQIGTQPFGGGSMTQLTGPQPGRARAQIGRAAPGVLVSPTRYVRMVSRTLCAPGTTSHLGLSYFDVNADAPVVLADGLPGSGNVLCWQRAQTANGLYTGQYLAPIGEYIFPENVIAGDALVPFNFWSLDFLARGEGPGTGPLTPRPW